MPEVHLSETLEQKSLLLFSPETVSICSKIVWWSYEFGVAPFILKQRKFIAQNTKKFRLQFMFNVFFTICVEISILFGIYCSLSLYRKRRISISLMMYFIILLMCNTGLLLILIIVNKYKSDVANILNGTIRIMDIVQESPNFNTKPSELKLEKKYRIIQTYIYYMRRVFIYGPGFLGAVAYWNEIAEIIREMSNYFLQITSLKIDDSNNIYDIDLTIPLALLQLLLVLFHFYQLGCMSSGAIMAGSGMLGVFVYTFITSSALQLKPNDSTLNVHLTLGISRVKTYRMQMIIFKWIQASMSKLFAFSLPMLAIVPIFSCYFAIGYPGRIAERICAAGFFITLCQFAVGAIQGGGTVYNQSLSTLICWRRRIFENHNSQNPLYKKQFLLRIVKSLQPLKCYVGDIYYLTMDSVILYLGRVSCHTVDLLVAFPINLN